MTVQKRNVVLGILGAPPGLQLALLEPFQRERVAFLFDRMGVDGVSVDVRVRAGGDGSPGSRNAIVAA
eukprot:3710501-Pyramimonas_sp.AAC.1